MLKYILKVFLCLVTLNLSAQSTDLSYANHLLDSLRQLPPLDTTDYAIDELTEVNKDISILHATVYFDCNGDECFEARKGLITSNQGTLPPTFTDIIHLRNGELVLIGLRKVMQINTNLNVTRVYDSFGPMIEELAVFTKNGRYGLSNISGEVLLPPTYAYIENNEDNDVILFQKEGQWGVHDKNVLLKREEPDEFDNLEVTYTLLKVQNPKTYRWAFFSREAEQLTAYKYDDVIFTGSGDATASIDGYWGMINDEGKEATAFKYDEIRSGMGVTYIGVRGSISAQYGLVSIEGELTPVKYSKISTTPVRSNVSKAYYWAAKEANAHWGLLKLRGQPLTKFIYKEINLKDPNRPKGLLNGKWVELIK